MKHKISNITDRNKLITSKETNKMVLNYYNYWKSNKNRKSNIIEKHYEGIKSKYKNRIPWTMAELRTKWKKH